MDFFTSDVLATGADRRPDRDLTASFLSCEHGVQAGARTGDRLCEGGTPWRRPVC
ncbi:hypothetical protein JIX56_32180 [Streptomyces sp. CA-210063]|uniref:hypothetical protein n=1 Tax=Streptomyces sp. CA-210063 TaxID=2801029 RepID=UPI00214CC686|nr:hypothetical protein [Streptomyces sp. CA-210063]UUU34124.1 hypothetical protein JIX56_32180 [Streptomyces sp. CA-210063]